MLAYVEETYNTTHQKMGLLRQRLCWYSSSLVSRGFLARKWLLLTESAEDGAIRIGGILSAPSAMDDAMRVESLKDDLESITSILTVELSRRICAASVSPEDMYCVGHGRKSVRMQCDVTHGLSSIRCNECGGFIARYQLQQTTALESLWSWETEYDSITQCWLASGEYEDWSAAQLFDVTSPLSRLGLDTARQLGIDNGLEVLYALESGETERTGDCPKCGKSFDPVELGVWNAVCKDCGLLVSLS